MALHAETLLYRGSLLTIREFRCSGEDLTGSHEEAALEHEIVFPRSGIYVRRDAGGKVLADPNHVLFFHRDQPYQVTHPHEGGDVSTVMTIEPRVLLELLNSATQDSIVDPNRPFRRNAIRIAPVMNAAHRALLNAIENAQGEEALVLEEQILTFLHAVLSQKNGVPVTGHPCCQSTTSRKAHEDLVRHSKIVIGRCFREKLSLDFIARQVHHSPYSLSRIFRNHTGVTLHQYLLRVRLLHGLEMLAESGKASIGEIGVDLGFASPSHFTTAFYQVFSLTPSDFREKINGRTLLRMENSLIHQ
jgi:AraC family transcriptional regulator